MNYILQLVELLKNNCIVISKFFAVKNLRRIHKNAIEGAPNNSHRFCYQSLGLRALRNHTWLRMALQQYPANKSILLFASCCNLQSDVCLLKSLDPADQITALWLGTPNCILQEIATRPITTEGLQAVVADSIFCFRPEELCDARHDSWNNVDLLVINTVYNFTCIVLSSLSGSTNFLTPKGKLLIRLKLL